MNVSRYKRIAASALAILFASAFLACGSDPGEAEPSDAAMPDTASDDVAVDVVLDAVTPLDVRPNYDVADTDCDTLGCACEADGDCLSRYCLDHSDGGRICSERCTDSCSLPGYECVYLENSDGDGVELCVPAADPYCSACTVPTDCGSLRAMCVPLDDGRWCLSPCDDTAGCREGTQCTTLDIAGESQSVCVPRGDVCSPCIDEDNDGYGRGAECLGIDPDDNDPTVFPGAVERCDEKDNDGDGEIDEGFDLLSDPEHCGACGQACALDNAAAVCIDGACAIDSCDDGWGDCDPSQDGCETDLSDPNLCGACGPYEGAIGDACGTCDSGVWACDETLGRVCENDQGTDALNACGGCAPLDDAPETACGACDLGTWICSEDGNALHCEDDPGEDAINACGGCTSLAADPLSPCGTCDAGLWQCDGADAVICEGDPGDDAPNSCAVLGTLRTTPYATGDGVVRARFAAPHVVGTSDTRQLQAFPVSESP